MQLKPEVSTRNSSAVMPVPSVCGNCGVEERRLLHHLRHRGIFRRLCTTCVLRLNPQCFCPICFQVYPPTPSNNAVHICSKCYSSTHSHCGEVGPASPPLHYICSLCLHTNTPIFKLKSAKDVNLDMSKVENCLVMDKDAAKKLLAAAKIASASMNKAAVAAKAEAERRAKEAAFTRKRAKEALEHVARLTVKEKMMKKEAIVKMERDCNVNILGNNRNESVAANPLGPSMDEKDNMNTAGNVTRVDDSNQILAALNAVEEKMVTTWSVGSGVSLTDDNIVIDVDEKGSMRMVDGEDDVGGSVGDRNNDSGSDLLEFADMESGAETLNIEVEKPEDVPGEVVFNFEEDGDANDGPL